MAVNMAANKAELDRINSRARGEIHRDTRLEWAGEWSARISAMLESPCKKEVPGRLWRLRYFDTQGDYLVCTLVQNIKPMPGTPTGASPKIMVFLTRPYTRATVGGAATFQLQLFGEYSVDEVVAFLALDLLSPDDAQWRDETKYSDFLIVRDVIAAHRRD